MNNAGIGSSPLMLKDLIRQVKQELLAVISEREELGEAPIFALNDLTLEVNFVVATEGKIGGNVSVKLLAVAGLNANGERKYSREQVHRVTLHLSPLGRSPSESSGAAMQPGAKYKIPSGVRELELPLREGIGLLELEKIHIKGLNGDPSFSVSLSEIVSTLKKHAKEADKGFEVDTKDLIARLKRNTE